MNSVSFSLLCFLFIYFQSYCTLQFNKCTHTFIQTMYVRRESGGIVNRALVLLNMLVKI